MPRIVPTEPLFSFSSNETVALNFLNQGGRPADLVTEIRRDWRRRTIFTKNEVIKDLTGDGVPEILIIPSEAYVFGCKDGKYQTLLKLENESAGFNGIENQLVAIKDMNLDGIPEVVIANFGCGGFGAAQCLSVYVLEWIGVKFEYLSPTSWPERPVLIGGRMNGLPDVQIRDIDGNGTLELILIGGIPIAWYRDHYSDAPWRDQSDIYAWDGRYFVYYRTEYSPAIYRYQALQDGDRAFNNNEYAKALSLYQDAIFNNRLLGWSQAKKDRDLFIYDHKWDEGFDLTPTPTSPPDDPNEYPNLAAYARYRIMLIHILEGHRPEAQRVYEILQENFPAGSSGHEFALMAKAFWGEYLLSADFGQSCTKAISVAESNKGVLAYLGSSYHGIQDMQYEPEDICPFK